MNIIRKENELSGYVAGQSKKEGAFKIPVVDVRDGEQARNRAANMVKVSNGNNSRHIPGKWGYGKYGPQKY